MMMKKVNPYKVLKRFISFCKHEENITLYPWQKELALMLFISLFITGDDVFIKVSRQSGKTETVTLVLKFLMVFHHSLLKRPVMFAIASPTGEQAKTDIDRIKKKIPDMRASFGLDDREFNAHTIRSYISDTLVAEGYKFSLRPTASNESKTLNLLVIEEAHKTNDKKRSDELDPMLASTGGPTWFIGVGNVKMCDFKRGCDGELNDSKSLIVDAERVIREKQAMYELDGNVMHLAYKDLLDKLLRKYGRENPEIKRNFYLEDTVESGNFISSKRLYSMRRPSSVVVPTDNLGMGLDWARSSDHTWLFLINDFNDVVDMFKYPHTRYDEQIELIMLDLKRNRGTEAEPWTYLNKIVSVRGDSTGQGDMPMEELQKTELPVGEESKVKFTLQSKHAIYSALQNVLYKDDDDPYRFSYPEDHPLAGEFEEQMIQLEKEYKGDGEYLSVYHPKDDPNARDDAPDSCGLAIYSKTNESIKDIMFA